MREDKKSDIAKVYSNDTVCREHWYREEKIMEEKRRGAKIKKRKERELKRREEKRKDSQVFEMSAAFSTELLISNLN
jgi:hypothetical protein